MIFTLSNKLVGFNFLLTLGAVSNECIDVESDRFRPGFNSLFTAGGVSVF